MKRIPRSIRILSTCLVLIASALAADRQTIVLWPGGAPGEKGDIGPEADTTTPQGDLIAGKRVIRLGNVTVPTITVYPAPQANSTRAAVVVMPGGGYHILAMDLEGTEVCEWLNSIGVTGMLLKYRVPARKGGPRYAAPLQDAQRALGMVRARAAEWNLDPHKIGTLGFSAGAHLTAALGANFETRTYETVDDSDQVSPRPDFSVLIYPGGLTVNDQGGTIGPELRVTSSTPPTFLVQAEDDGVRVENSLYYYLALRNAKVPAEMHLFATGGHGYGLRPMSLPVTEWPKLAERWLRTIGVR